MVVNVTLLLDYVTFGAMRDQESVVNTKSTIMVILGGGGDA
jgi:hypothetical protein